ncbi:hypothetical protein AOQ84DRAFT_419102 [Glonium stellatum]|uniref:Uncharacterized protein n=1 Tax=Glonium stellatum TaxID=574774 RepID=A0A8E2FDA1_9PEZI|nr:hypothetical protein AOQ84DRAFT_419102 [Glonium stellatum]
MSNSTPDSTPLVFSEHEMKLLAYAWQCFDSEPKIDYEKLAPLAGYTVGSAKVTLGKLRRKMKAAAGDGAAPAKTPGTTPSTTPRKRKTAANGDAGSPTKRSRKPKAIVEPASTMGPVDDDEVVKTIKDEEGTDFLSSVSENPDTKYITYQQAV